MKKTLLKIKGGLASLSFKTGVVVLAMCIPFYVASFAQMALPISAQAKTALWVTLFGLAKPYWAWKDTAASKHGSSEKQKKIAIR